MSKLSTNASVVIVVAIGVACAAYLAIAQSPLASTVIPLIITLVGGVVVQLLKQGTTEAKVDAGALVSQQNNDQLAVMAPQVRQAVVQATEAASQASQAIDAVADNTTKTEATQQTANATHLAVNSRMDELIARVEQQGRALAELAGAQGRAAGIEEGRAQAAAEAATPPTEREP